MKRLIIFLFMLPVCCASVKAQTSHNNFVLKINNLPGIYSWVKRTDYNETGKWNTTTGADTSAFSFYENIFFSRIYKDNNLMRFWNDVYTLNFYFDSLALNLDSLDFGGGTSFTPSYSFSFKMINNIQLHETDSTLDYHLIGDQILSHNLFLDTLYIDDNVGSCCQDENYFQNTGRIIPSTEVYFSISKKDVILNDVSNPIPLPSFVLFPVPASNALEIKLPSNYNISDVSIYDLLGRTKLAFNTEQSFHLDISSLPPGIYYLRAGNQMQKFVIQR